MAVIGVRRRLCHTEWAGLPQARGSEASRGVTVAVALLVAGSCFLVWSGLEPPSEPRTLLDEGSLGLARARVGCGAPPARVRPRRPRRAVARRARTPCPTAARRRDGGGEAPRHRRKYATRAVGGHRARTTPARSRSRRAGASVDGARLGEARQPEAVVDGEHAADDREPAAAERRLELELGPRAHLAARVVAAAAVAVAAATTADEQRGGVDLAWVSAEERASRSTRPAKHRRASA